MNENTQTAAEEQTTNAELEFETDAPQEDQLGVYPQDVHVPPLEGRRYLWTSRAFAVALYMSLLANFVMALGLFTAWQYKEIVPMMVSFDDSKDKFIRINPISPSMPGVEILTEKLVGEYVKIREEIVLNEEEMRYRFNEYIQSRTSPDEFKKFYRAKAGTYKEFLENEVVREVDIEDVDLSPNKRYYQIDFSTTDYDLTRTPIGKDQWRAFLTVRYIPKNVAYNERFVNPLGFEVVQYSVRRRK